MTLAGMPAYLVCRLTREVVSPDYLQPDDARAALCGSEFLEVDRWMAENAWFPRRRGWTSGMIIDLSWGGGLGIRLALLERQFLEAIRGDQTRSGRQSSL